MVAIEHMECTGGVLALDLDGVLFVSPEPAGVVGEYADRRRVRVKVPCLRDVWGMRVSEPVWVSPSMIADVNGLLTLPGVRLVWCRRGVRRLWRLPVRRG